MPRPRRANPIAVALYVNAALLLAILVAVVSGGRVPSVLPEAFGQVPQPIAGGSGMYLMPAQFAVNSWGCYVMDVDAQTLIAYEFMPARGGKLKLVTARSIRHDRKLQRFNIDNPSPEEVEKLVEMEKNARRGNDREPVEPDPDAVEQDGTE
jgi:hypothetical protein